MEHTASIILRWTGRACVLLAVFVLVASLFLPDAVAPLSPVVCPDGTDLSNTPYTGPNAPKNEDLELVCTSREYTESAAPKVLTLCVILLVVGVAGIWIGDRMDRPKTQAPSVPGMRG